MDAELPLLLTKLELPPLRAHTLGRPHLLALLRTAPETRLVLASAPAGFGKTTLLAAWCHALRAAGEACVAWVTLDDGDNDPARFLAYLMAAVSRALGLRAGADEAAPAPGTRVRAEVVLTRLINQIVAGGRPCQIVLDDYHLISAPAVHSAVAFLLGHLPAGSCLAIGGRSDPPLPLARLHVRGELIELRAAELRFREDEVRAFLAMVGVGNLPPAEVAAVIAMAEGWPAGAQLMALALRSGARLQAAPGEPPPDLAEHSHHLFAYLAEEVFARQAPDTRRFLLRTSVLDRMCGPLCDELLAPGDADSATTLAELDQASLFVVPIDAEQRWYRYHHLFRGFLASRLAAEEPALVADLHRRAGDWCLRNGLPASALEHAFAADDVERAVGLIERFALTLIERGEYATLRRWLDRTPAAARAAHPGLDLWDAWAALLSGAVERVRPALARASRAWEGTGDRASLGAAAHLRAHLARLSGDPDATIAAARQALADLPAAEVTLRAGSLLALGIGQLLAGDLDAAEATLGEALTHCAAHNFLGALAAYTALGDLAMCRGQLDTAESYYERVLADSGEHTHWERWVASGRLGELARRRGQLDDACELLRGSLEAAERAGVALYLIPEAIAYAHTLAALGDGDGARQSLDRALGYAHRLTSAPYQHQVRAEISRLRLAAAMAPPAPQSAALGPQPLVEPLSEREIDVLELVARGASNQDIAEQLVISVGTVKSHLNHILGKLDARNRTEAVARARDIGVLA